MYQTPTLQELLEAGVHFGHQVRRGHPRMKPYIFGAREGVHIIDLTQSEKFLKEACEFIYNLGKEEKSLLFVATKKQARPIVQEAAKRLNAPYMLERWMGGFLTNHDEIYKNIKKLKEYLGQKESGKLAKYTKKEQLLLERAMNKLQRDFEGVLEFEGLPDAVFIIDTVSENVAVREASRMKIKIVAIADSNSNPSNIDYPIPGNDDAIKSIQILTDTVAQAYEAGKKEAGKIADKKAATEAKAKEKADKIEISVTKEVELEAAEAEEKLEKAAVKDAERKV